MDKKQYVKELAAFFVRNFPETPRMLADPLLGSRSRSDRAVLTFFSFHEKELTQLGVQERQTPVLLRAVLAEAVAQMANEGVLNSDLPRQPTAVETYMFAESALQTYIYGRPLTFMDMDMDGPAPAFGLMPE